MFVIVFIDDIVIYSRNEQNHVNHLKNSSKLSMTQNYMPNFLNVSSVLNLQRSQATLCLAKEFESTLKRLRQCGIDLNHLPIDIDIIFGVGWLLQKIVEEFSYISSPLTKLTMKVVVCKKRNLYKIFFLGSNLTVQNYFLFAQKLLR